MSARTDERAVVLTVPATAEHLSLLRTLIGYYAGREQFTLDQIDDLKMAVDEAAVQLLRQIAGDAVRLEISRAPAGIAVRVSAEVQSEEPLIDREAFSWAILEALSDELDVEQAGGSATVVLVKHQVVGAGPTSAGESAGGKVGG